MIKNNPNLAIIGAGLSGLVAAKHALSQDYDNIVILEKKSTLGGIWSPEGYAWPGLSCNISKFSMIFPYFQFFETDDLYPKTDVVFDYLDEIAEAFNIKKHIKFETNVDFVIQNPDLSFKIHWTDKNGKHEQNFDRVIVAGGKMNKMDYGNFEKYRNKQNGCLLEIMHTGEYKSSDTFKNKRVMVLGVGHSSTQLCSEICKVSSDLINVFRNPHFVMPRIIYQEKYKKVIPREFIYLSTRAGRIPKENLNRNEIIRLNNKLFSQFSNQNDIHPDLYIPPDSEKRFGLSVADEYLENVKQGKFKVIKSNIKEIIGSNVILENGQMFEIDILMLGIGYLEDFSYLDEKIQKILEYNPYNKFRPLNLDLSYVYNRNIRNLAFVGVQTAPTIWSTHDFQAMVAIQYLKHQDNYDEFYKRLEEVKQPFVYSDSTGYIELMAKELDWIPDFEFIKKNDVELFDYVMNGPYLVHHFMLKERNYGTKIWEKNAEFIRRFNRELKQKREIIYE